MSGYGGTSLTGFPRGGITSYAKARRHFDSVKPWESKYNPNWERPIGTRAVKTSDGYRFNKAMRELPDGSIAFRLYNTDCVIWHPDNRLTVTGYASAITGGFISRLTPDGVSHSQGRKDENEPILHLRGPRPIIKPRMSWEKERPIWSAHWNSGQIVQCGRPVLLQCRSKIWRPARPDLLEPFYVPTIDRRMSRELAKQFHLAEFERLAKNEGSLITVGEAGHGLNDMERACEIMNLLEVGRVMQALRLVPRGPIRHKFTHRMVGTEFGAQPGFLRWLRDEIYDTSGAVKREEIVSLTPSQYDRFKRDVKRF
jgi:hypothetical protein